MSKGKGYLLPAGDAYTDELRCAIVYYPNKDEYRRALRGSLDYLATWVAWERDASHRGKDAARAWKEANELTAGCIEMTNCLDDLLSELQSIKSILGNLILCCDGDITYGTQPEISTDIVPGVGDPPGYYGETPITTWEEWEDHVCYNANRYVDFLVQQAENFAVAAQTSSWVIGLVAAGLAILSFTGIGLPISYALASTVLFGLLQAGSGTFDGVAEDLENARDEIVCALLSGNSLEDVVGDAIGTNTPAWLVLFQFVDYGSATSILYEGGYGGEYLPADTSDCNCDEPVPNGYELIPFDFTSCTGCNGTISYSGNTATLTNYILPGGAYGYYTLHNPVVGFLAVTNLTSSGTSPILTIHGSNPVCGTGVLLHNNWNLNNTKTHYCFVFTDSDYAADWTDYIAAHTPNYLAATSACSNPQFVTFKRDAGTFSGTIQFYSIRAI